MPKGMGRDNAFSFHISVAVRLAQGVQCLLIANPLKSRGGDNEIEVP